MRPEDDTAGRDGDPFGCDDAWNSASGGMGAHEMQGHGIFWGGAASARAVH